MDHFIATCRLQKCLPKQDAILFSSLSWFSCCSGAEDIHFALHSKRRDGLCLPGEVRSAWHCSFCQAAWGKVNDVGAVWGLQGGNYLHSQIVHLGLFLDYLQLLYIKTCGFFLMSIKLPVLRCYSYLHRNLLKQKIKKAGPKASSFACLVLHMYFKI